MMKKLLCEIIIAAVLLTGCGFDLNMGGETATEATPIPSPSAIPTEMVVRPERGGTLRLSMRLPKTLNPVLNEDITVDGMLRLIFEPLMILDESQMPVPNLASDVEFATDGLSAVITLRQNANWSDGTPVTTADLVYTIDAIRNAPEGSVYASSVENIASCTPTSEKTAKLTFNQGFCGTPYLLCFPLIPAQYYKNAGLPYSTKNMTPLGNGAFVFDSYIDRKEVVLKQSDSYFKQTPYIEEVRVLITADVETDMYSFDQGIIDVISADLADWSKYHGAKETRIIEYPTSLYDFIGFNFNNPFLQDRNVRQAIAYAVDTEGIINTVYLGHALRADSPINPSSWVYEPETSDYAFDLTQAGRLFSTSGFEADTIFRILVNEENEERVKVAGVLAENLSKCGVNTSIEKMPFDEYTQRLENGDFDIFIGGFNLSVIPDLTFAFHSSQIEGGFNFFSYSDVELDALLGDVFRASDQAIFKNALSKLQKYMASELVTVSICFRKSAVLMGNGVYGEILPSYGNIYNNINEWYTASHLDGQK